MALSNRWKKPTEVKQGLKICIYGNDGCGKSTDALCFPNIAAIDSEAKIGTYVNHPVFGQNLLGVVDSSSYYDAIDTVKELIEDSDKPCETFLIDSETKIYSSLSVACMEIEEERAKKKNKGNVEISDQVVSQRGYGKIKLNEARLSALKAALSSKGVTVIVTAHAEDVYSGTGDNKVKVGERPALRKKAEHDYDIIIKKEKGKDLGTGKPKWTFTCEKDTTETFELFKTIEYNWVDEHTPNDLIYQMLKPRIAQSIDGTKGNSYGNVIDKDIEKGLEAQKTATDTIEEFATLFAQIKGVGENVTLITKELSNHGIKNPKDVAYAEKLALVIEFMHKLPKQ